MKSTKFWITLFAALLLVSAVAAAFISRAETGGVTANIYQNGECIHSIDLSQVGAPYTIVVSGRVQNTIAVENGRICVLEATCPDQVCVHQGWISNSVVPVVCLPNELVIQIENTPGTEMDAVAR